MNYRPEIDGLRAIAIIPVILFHAGFSVFSGGFVGVDVFFVISGYLITTIIFQEMTEGKFSIWSFYERRAKRILPALFIVTLLCIPFAWLWMLPSEFKDFSQSIAGVATFTSNIFFWRESGYFEDPAELKPLLHTWSLAVEEQFYIFYPPLLLILYKLVPKRLFIIIALITLCSLCLSQWASSAYASANFYLLPTRAWEMGIGALVALHLQNNKVQKQNLDLLPSESSWQLPWQQVISLLGISLITYSILFFDKNTPFPSVWALIPVLGTAFIILAANEKTLVGKLLSHKSLVGIGLVSYSAYLWHQPIFAFARIRIIDGVTEWVFVGLIVLTFVLSVVTYFLIENPVRKSKSYSRLKVLSSAFLACVAFIFISWVGQERGELAYADSIINKVDWKKNVSPVRLSCHATAHDPILPAEACNLAEGNANFVFLWGDSHGVELSWTLAKEIKKRQIPLGFKQITASQCIPVPGVSSLRETHCVEHNDRVFDYLTQQSMPGIVILSARWPLYFIGERVNHANGCTEMGELGSRFVSSIEENDRKDKLGLKLRETISALIAAGHKVLFVHAPPEPGCDVPAKLARYELFSDEQDLLYSADIHLERKSIVSYHLKGIFNDSFTTFDPTDVYCDIDNLTCKIADKGAFYFDDDHPSIFVSEVVSSKLIHQLLGVNWLEVGETQ
ncbi:acyltransferase family protein [Neptuniibacter sp. QD57_21]|uniref:acyltransferase family protein n=1 Tax=Neptuniibacter sp. QD57_21 TaxID=3398213 RepID=UPI0039F4AB4D